jgi:hypothetical protein
LRDVLVACLAIGVLAKPGTAQAQICAGRVSFDAAPVQLVVDTEHGSAGRAAFTIARGTDRLFLSAAAGREWRDEEPSAASTLSVGAGSSQPLRPDNRLHACPELQATLAHAGDTTRLAGHAGVSVGFSVLNGSSMGIVPTVSALVRQDGFGRSGVDVEAGGGFILRRRLSVSPAAVFAFRGARRVGLKIAAAYHFRGR